jgi:hypothetical protein
LLFAYFRHEKKQGYPQKIFDAGLLKLLKAFKYNKAEELIKIGFPTH